MRARTRAKIGEIRPMRRDYIFAGKCTGRTCDWVMEAEEHVEDFEVNEEDYLAAGGLMRIISGRIEHIVDFSNALIDVRGGTA